MQYFRTALHYVYGMEFNQQLITVMEDHGMSEYVMDKASWCLLHLGDLRVFVLSCVFVFVRVILS